MTVPQDPRNIPILTEAVDPDGADVRTAEAAILAETLELADALLRQAVKDIEATLFDQVYGRLRAGLPALVHRALRLGSAAPAGPGAPIDHE